MTDFNALGLSAPILKALAQEGYTTPTPIQARSIPLFMQGRDILGLAQTGTGKTASFALPILERLQSDPIQRASKTARALILAPTRELAGQIADSFRTYARFLSGLKLAVVFGGVGQQAQVNALKHGVDVLVAAPGRLLDLLNQGYIKLGQTDILVLDEADRMLDMGFIHDIRKVVAMLPEKHQTLLFSATMPASVRELARSLQKDPALVEVTPESRPVDRISQNVLFVDEDKKKEALLSLLNEDKGAQAIVFTLMKHEVNKIVEFLERHGIHAAALHGNKSQAARERALAGFRAGKVQVLAATDIAARGIDVDDLPLVINYDLPNVPESYVHRIGRTGRAGKGGRAVSLCDPTQRAWLREIERRTKLSIPYLEEHPFHSETARLSTLPPPVLGGGRRGGGGRGRPGGGSGRRPSGGGNHRSGGGRPPRR